jgi:hypothetical protein
MKKVVDFNDKILNWLIIMYEMLEFIDNIKIKIYICYFPYYW